MKPKKINTIRANQFKIYLSGKEIALKQKIEESIQLFYKMNEEFNLSKTKLDLECHNHFQEIRFQIDQHREELKQRIDDIYMDMIEKTKEVEASYLKSLNENIEDSPNSYDVKSAEEDLKELEEAFRNPNLLIKTIKEMHQKQEEAIQAINRNETK